MERPQFGERLAWLLSVAIALAVALGYLPPVAVPPLPKPPAQPQPQEHEEYIHPLQDKTNLRDGVHQIFVDRHSCSSVAISPKRGVTAAHCVKHVGTKGQVSINNKRYTFRVLAVNHASDVALFELTNGKFTTWRTIATKERPGAVYHAGYGVHKPSNVEAGKRCNGRHPNGSAGFWLSVSSGDSGAPICDAAGNVVSIVSRTGALGRYGHVLGCDLQSLRAIAGCPT